MSYDMSGRDDRDRRRDRTPNSPTRSRSRSRSPRGRREFSPRPGMSDLTNDPSTVNARIFVGSISVNMTRETLMEYFSQFGKVVGVSITRTKFGFVQFSNEEEAINCLNAGTTAYIDGQRVDVKPAKFGGGSWSGPGGGMGGNAPLPVGFRRGQYENERGASPMQRPMDDYYDYYSRMPEERPRDHYDDMYDEYYRSYYERYDDYHRSRAAVPESHSSRSYQSYQEPMDPLDPSRPNDVEIVVPNKAQRGYAENIEAQLKSVNLLVDLLFPPPDIPPSQVLVDLSRRNTLYAIFVTADNESHRSITLNILHGTPQEHRNMPVEDALRLIDQNFQDYVKKIRQRNMREVVPRDIRHLMCDLLEAQPQPLSMGDLDKIIKYLKERQSYLVDDQIEQKRETASGVSASRHMAVTYPGYNYGSSSLVGSGTPVGSSTAGAEGVGSSSVSMVPPPTAMAAVSGTAYPGYGNMPSMYGAYNMAPHMPVAPVAAPMMPSGGVGGSGNKQSELQERILNLMKGSGGAIPTGVPPPSGVPAPTGVPPPSGVPPPHMVGSGWRGDPSSNKANNGPMKNNQSAGQGQGPLFAAYNPWTQ